MLLEKVLQNMFLPQQRCAVLMENYSIILSFIVPEQLKCNYFVKQILSAISGNKYNGYERNVCVWMYGAQYVFF